ncbi:signal recognition particle protein [Candidatus Pelagibacter communis]|jgi:signal recognition particle subunit SRP54|uniref:signal recognition particle protein n=1 Tax=Pelagibacter ubique TaxID=198252 RepID=UPI00094C11C5|nr:signal recognition particle protein [Candidatus Pelagibacter ubique]|tara:strand:- start:104 stop:1462 length:1359 start_codon:yes stop_codon:yes gene_type:complete
MFENLTNKFEGILDKFKKSPSLDEGQVDDGLRLIRQALLEADVSLDVAKEFINNVKPKVLGKEILRSTAPGQMVVKIVYDELVNFLGDKNQEINLKSNPPISIMMVGLQGSGKTTSTAKLSKFLEKNNKKKIMMASLDIYRPAAQDQLKVLGEQNNIQTLPIIEGQTPTDICRRALTAANLNGSDVIIFDTAGRTQIDLQMMSEIKQIEEVIKPTETILVADSLTGQVAANVAKEFGNTVKLTGIILTRADGDGRGGAALSMKHVANVPIKFLGIGEKIENLEIFHPDRIANRILGMGDIVSLVEKAAQDIDEEKLKEAEETLKKGQFSLDDYLTQLRQMKKMGGIEGVMSFLPGVSKLKSQMDQAGVDEKIITQNEAVILSMTKQERDNPKIINGSRKKRIANGSGTDIATINKLLKQFKMMSDMMKKMSKGNTKGLMDKGLPPELFNQLK